MYRAIRLATLLLPLASVLALPTTPEETSAVRLQSIGINGSGCPSGTFNNTFLPDGTLLTEFDAFSLTSDAPIFGTRQNCQHTLAVSIPAGKQVTIGKLDYAGYLWMTRNINVYRDAFYYFQGEIEQGESKDTIKGPKYGAIDYKPTFSEKIWSKCGPTELVVNINFALHIDDNDKYNAWGYSSVNSAKIGPFEVRSC